MDARASTIAKRQLALWLLVFRVFRRFSIRLNPWRLFTDPAWPGVVKHIPQKSSCPPGGPDGHEECYSSLWELGGLSREALAKDWLPNAKSLATTSSSSQLSPVFWRRLSPASSQLFWQWPSKVSLSGPFGCLLASELAPSEVESSPIGNPTQRICHNSFSRECAAPLLNLSLSASPSPVSGMGATAIES